MTLKNSNLQLKLSKSALEEIQRQTKLLEEKRDKILKSETVPSLLWNVITFYGNTMTQGAETVELIKATSNSDFINSVKQPRVGTNEVVFSKGNYFVKFPKAFIKGIKIGRLEETIKKKPIEPQVNDVVKMLMDRIELYRDGEISVDEMKVYYISYYLKKQANFFNMRKVSLEQLEIFITEIESSYNSFRIAHMNWEKNLEEYNSYAKNDTLFLIDVMKYLKQFEEEGWKINIERLHEDAVKFKEFI